MSNINNYALKQNTILYGKSHTYTIEKILGQDPPSWPSLTATTSS